MTSESIRERDWARTETVPAFMSPFIETGGTAGIQFSYDRSRGVAASTRIDPPI